MSKLEAPSSVHEKRNCPLYMKKGFRPLCTRKAVQYKHPLTKEIMESEEDALIELIATPTKELTRKERSRLNKEAWKERAKNPVVKAMAPIATAHGKKQRMQEFKEKLLTEHNGTNVIRKVLEIAMNDEHPGQINALKMCMDRMLPTAMFEPKKGGNRTAVQINITGIGEAPIVIENETGEIDE